MLAICIFGKARGRHCEMIAERWAANVYPSEAEEKMWLASLLKKVESPTDGATYSRCSAHAQIQAQHLVQ